MKNITAFAVLVILLGLVLSVPASGDEQPQKKIYGFSLSPQFGMIYGQAIEIVYPSPLHHNKYLSEILWDMKPVWYYGAALELERINPYAAPGFFAAFSFKMGIPGKSGSTENRDWLFPVSGGEESHYSCHENTTSTLLILDGDMGASIPAGENCVVRIFATVSYMHFAFEAFNGYGKYTEESDRSVKNLSFSGKIHTYSQSWLVFGPGISVGQRFSRYFAAEVFFKISPFIFCKGFDEHLHPDKRNDYQDFPQWGLFIEPRLALSLDAVEGLTFEFNFTCRNITGSRGDSYMKKAGSAFYTYTGKSAGAALSLVDASLSAKIRF